MHRVAAERESGASVIDAHGELDAFAAGDIDSVFDQVAGAERVVADLTRVSFLDSTALGLIVRRLRELREAGATVRVVLPSGTAARIFHLTTLDRVLPVAASRAEALRELHGR